MAFVDKQGNPIDIPRLSGTAATHVAIDACVAGNEALMRALCTRAPRFDPDAVDSDGDGPVHYAVSCAQLPCLQVLLEHGANATRRSGDGSNCLHIAAQYGLSDFMEPLLASKVSVNSHTRQGLCALDVALQQRKAAFTHQLLDRRCDVACVRACAASTRTRTRARAHGLHRHARHHRAAHLQAPCCVVPPAATRSTVSGVHVNVRVL